MKVEQEATEVTENNESGRRMNTDSSEIQQKITKGMKVSKIEATPKWETDSRKGNRR